MDMIEIAGADRFLGKFEEGITLAKNALHHRKEDWQSNGASRRPAGNRGDRISARGYIRRRSGPHKNLLSSRRNYKISGGLPTV